MKVHLSKEAKQFYNSCYVKKIVMVYSTKNEKPGYVSAAWQQAAKRCFINMDSVISELQSTTGGCAGGCVVELVGQSKATTVLALALLSSSTVRRPGE